MTKIEELVKLLDDLKSHSEGRAFLPRSAFNNAAPFIVNAALEALPELREAAIALDGFRVWCAELNDSPPLHELLRVDEDRGAE